jgi:aminoglycoside phosphotransferase (APT) family kinase protein
MTSYLFLFIYLQVFQSPVGPGRPVRGAKPGRGILAVLDWELSTVGSPYGDVAYCCMPYNLPPASVNTPAAYPAFQGSNPPEVRVDFIFNYLARVGNLFADGVFFSHTGRSDGKRVCEAMVRRVGASGPDETPRTRRG